MREKTITLYITNDGIEYRRREDAERHERDAAAIAQVFADMPPRPVALGEAFMNGQYYIQHAPGVTRSRLWSRLRNLPDAPHPRDCPKPWDAAYYRVDCIDEFGREWGQAYFALNPNASAVPLDARALRR